VTSLGLPTCYQVDSTVASSGQPYDASQDFPQLSFTFGNASLVLHPDDYIQFIEVLDSRVSMLAPPGWVHLGAECSSVRCCRFT
jgi:hypothetical protein